MVESDPPIYWFDQWQYRKNDQIKPVLFQSVLLRGTKQPVETIWHVLAFGGTYNETGKIKTNEIIVYEVSK
jgi:hypothetical protein